MSGFFLLTLIITAVMANNASVELLAPIVIENSSSSGVTHKQFLYQSSGHFIVALTI